MEEEKEKRHNHGSYSGSSHLLSTSLAEHSYCLSFPSQPPGSGEEHDNITDLFHSSTMSNEVTSLSPVGYSTELGESDEVNFDGYNFSVPPSDGRSTELENMWGGGGSTVDNILIETGNTVEVEASSYEPPTIDLEEEVQIGLVEVDHNVNIVNEPAVHSDQDVVILNEEEQSKEKKGTAPKPERKRKCGKYTKKKYLPVIKNKEKRKNFLEKGLKEMMQQLAEAIKKTKCTGGIFAMFDGNLIEGDSLLPKVTQEQESSLVNSNMDDHPYAATMITQSKTSSAIRDHQYNSERFRDLYSIDSGNYIQNDYFRDLAFCKFVKSLYLQKPRLESRTGAQIRITLKYEDFVVTDKNHVLLENLIKRKRSDMLDEKLRITTAQVLDPYVAKPPPPCTPLTLLIPVLDGSSNALKVPLAFTIPAPASGNPLQQFSPVSVGSSGGAHILAPTSPTSDLPQQLDIQHDFSDHESVNSIASMKIENKIDRRDARNTRSPDILLTNSAFGSNTFQRASPAFSSSSNNTITSSFNQHSPQVTTISRGVKDSSSTTEPICTICFNENDGQSSSRNEIGSGFWIRCNDPFCYDMVHTSCVGFMVTHSAHLKQLPAYYCKSHR